MSPPVHFYTGQKRLVNDGAGVIVFTPVKKGDEMDAKERKTQSIRETAKILGIGLNQAYEAARRGEIPTIKIGKRILVPVAAFERMLQGAA
jgi:excisionase family DNA binding protein